MDRSPPRKLWLKKAVSMDQQELNAYDRRQRTALLLENQALLREAIAQREIDRIAALVAAAEKAEHYRNADHKRHLIQALYSALGQARDKLEAAMEATDRVIDFRRRK